MQLQPSLFILVFCAYCLAGCSSEGEKQAFDGTPSVVTVQPIINEVSGIADSKANAGYLWAHEDGGTKPQLYLINRNGQVVKTVHIKPTTNQDWEDMALSGGSIYLADIGDNNSFYPIHYIYRFPEPAMTIDTVRTVDTIRFAYRDGNHDAEAFLVDPITGDMFVITKWDNPSRIHRLTASSSTAVQIAEAVGQLNYSGVTGAAVSPDGKEVIVKTYLGLNYYTRTGNEPLSQTLQRQPKTIPYQAEPQGEAVCFAADNSGYFTVSEKSTATEVKMYFYRRSR